MTTTTSSEQDRTAGHHTMNAPPIVSAPEWEAARAELLVKEKALTRARDALAAERRRMPWLPVEKAYAFDGPVAKASLLDLLEGRRQLINPPVTDKAAGYVPLTTLHHQAPAFRIRSSGAGLSVTSCRRGP